MARATRAPGGAKAFRAALRIARSVGAGVSQWHPAKAIRVLRNGVAYGSAHVSKPGVSRNGRAESRRWMPTRGARRWRSAEGQVRARTVLSDTTASVRREEVFARVGGEEFVLPLRDTPNDRALAEAMLRAVDLRLYEANAAGRNGVRAARTEDTPGPEYR
jgi:hypothetical protein